MYSGTFPPASNRADWTGTVEIVNVEDDTPPTLDDVVIALGECRHPDLQISLAASTVSYETATGWISWVVDQATMRRFQPGTYPMGIILRAGTADVQLFAGTIQISDGVVR